VSEKGREKLKKQLLLSIKKKTDVKVEEVLFTDVAVQ
jgi:flagellar basal body-associated protein FliL